MFYCLHYKQFGPTQLQLNFPILTITRFSWLWNPSWNFHPYFLFTKKLVKFDVFYEEKLVGSRFANVNKTNSSLIYFESLKLFHYSSVSLHIIEQVLILFREEHLIMELNLPDTQSDVINSCFWPSLSDLFSISIDFSCCIFGQPFLIPIKVFLNIQICLFSKASKKICPKTTFWWPIRF